MRRRVVVVGLGDTGMLTAIGLARHADVLGVSVKPGLLSGQELGMRLTRPDEWARNYWIEFGRLRGLDRVQRAHGEVIGVDLAARTVTIHTADGLTRTEPFDALVIATGVTNGFWRRPTVQSAGEIDTAIAAAHARLADAASVAVIGGGAAAVNSAGNIARRWPDKRVDLYFPRDQALRSHHPRVWRTVSRRLESLGVAIHSGHRAELPHGVAPDLLDAGTVHWATGQPDIHADAVLWAVGQARPNTDWLPTELLDDGGFVRVGPDFRVPGQPGVFAIGDVAATDPLRSSARNRGDKLLVRNVRAELTGGRMRQFRPRPHRWGSVLGPQPDGLQVFMPTGHSFRMPAWSLTPIIQRTIYRGVRPPR